MLEPLHHKAYRKAWEAYRLTWDDDERKALGRKMDSWQDEFTFPEFQRFKITLPGYVELWGQEHERLLKKLR